jgi:hypothetical protein
VTNDTEGRLLTARERGDPATILDERHVDKAAWPTGNQVRAAGLVARGCCLTASRFLHHRAPGTIWRPLTGPASGYPWAVLWRAADDSGLVRAVVSCAPGDVKTPRLARSANQRAGS